MIPVLFKRKHTMDVVDALAGLQAGRLVLVDVREASERAQGFAPGSRHLPVGELKQRLDELPPDRPVAFICQSGRRSAMAASAARRAGLDALGGLLHEYGHALHHAHVSDQLPLELRRLEDASVTEAFATLFERLPTHEEWLKRYVRLPSAPARDASRMAAFQALTVLRRHCAKLPYELSLYRHGASPERAEEYADAQRRALFVEPHPGFFLFDVDPQLYVTRYLRAWALETRLTAHLTGRFNEDWWRNPTAGRWLQGLFARGGTDDAEALATEISAKGLTLPEAGARLVALLDR